MEVSNSGLIVDERAPTAKGVPLYFNALNKHKIAFNMNGKDHQVLLRHHSKPVIVPKANGTISHEENVRLKGDPNVVGIPVNDKEPSREENSSPRESPGESPKSHVCDIKDIESVSSATAPLINSPNRACRPQLVLRNNWRLDDTKGPYQMRPFSDTSSQISRPFSDATSVKSLASIGMGSTDGRKMIIRKIPQSPSELFNAINPPTPPTEYLFDAESYDGYSLDIDDSYRKPRKHHWSNKLQFVLACVGYSVGIGSVWRFPYLCYKSGGGVFLIPYTIIMVICGVPMLYMELAVGQFTGRGPIGALGKLCPLFKGAGLASLVISFLMSTYYSVIIAYGIYYFFTSFKPTHPWEECSNRWNTADCWVPAKLKDNIPRPENSRTPAEEFYDRKVLQISKGIEYPGSLRWELVACLLCAWFIVYFAIWKSIKSSAKVRYITATLPFILIVAFLAKSLTLEGASKGMQYFFKPKWELLKDSQVWISAAAQTFNSMGIAFGSMISFASYNRFNNNILHDTLAVSFVNAITSLLVGIFAFATIGNIATEQNTSIEDVISDGPGLIFYVYPQAMAKMPAARLWAALFFFMLICLALNSQFAIVEVVVTSLQDGFPTLIRRRLLCHEMLVFIICIVSFLCSLPNVTKGGIFFFQMLDHYAASISIMYLAFFEVIAIAWFYGVGKLSKNIQSMNGQAPNLYFKFCWLIAAPMLILAMWIFCLIDYEPPTYNNGRYHYPIWAVILGWFISSLSILCIPIYAAYIFMKKPGDSWLQKLRNALRPNLYECDKCGEHVCEHGEEVEEQEIQPMLVLKMPHEIMKSRSNGLHFETPNFSATATPNADSPLNQSPVILRAGRPPLNASKSLQGTLVTNSPVFGRSISQHILSQVDREQSFATKPPEKSLSNVNTEHK